MEKLSFDTEIRHKSKTYLSHRNQKYSIYSRSNDCTWGVTGLNRSSRVRSFIGLTNSLVQPPKRCTQLYVRNKIGTKGSVNEPFDVKQAEPSQEGKIGLAGRFRMAHA